VGACRRALGLFRGARRRAQTFRGIYCRANSAFGFLSASEAGASTDEATGATADPACGGRGFPKASGRPEQSPAGKRARAGGACRSAAGAPRWEQRRASKDAA
jgi:hypothetical protein